MQLERDILTVDETLSIGKETLDKIIDESFFDYKIGDQFFITAQPHTRHVVLDEELDEEGNCLFIYGDGQKIGFDDTYPLFTTGMLIELLSFHFHFNLTSFGTGWMLLWNNVTVIQSKEDELLVSFLWRALAEIVTSDKYVW
ncbi:hypothetical protein ACPV3A_04670 [Paenibacillus sp. Dod16]|uniref:hypothetical protein n=1 Tax=Paenibacillus sp. Dod16 TaxID=3416392 RepID=UPI003CF4B749